MPDQAARLERAQLRRAAARRAQGGRRAARSPASPVVVVPPEAVPDPRAAPYFHEDPPVDRAALDALHQLPLELRPPTLGNACALTPNQLAHCDPARLNLLCARGLPGAETMNVDLYVARLDRWAA